MGVCLLIYFAIAQFDGRRQGVESKLITQSVCGIKDALKHFGVEHSVIMWSLHLIIALRGDRQDFSY